MYYEVVKVMIQQKEFPKVWKEWTATFAMKPTGRTQENWGEEKTCGVWSTCAGQKVLARVLAGAYNERQRAQETIPG